MKKKRWEEKNVDSVTVIHFGFQSVFTEWFWCIMAGGIIVALAGKALGLL